jgi:hypothetical protein
MKLRELARIRAALRRLQAKANQRLAELHGELRRERARREAVERERAVLTAQPFRGPMCEISLQEALRGARQRSSQPRWREESDFYARNPGTMIDPDGGGDAA